MRKALTIIFVFLTRWLNGQTQYDFVVAQDGSGDFRTIQDAIYAVPDFRKVPTKIFVSNGVYKEKLTLPTSKTNVNLVGEDVLKTILSYHDYATKKNHFGEEMGTSATASFFIFADDFSASNVTFENSAGPVGQAVAVRVSGDRVKFLNCRFIGFQDTLYAHGEKSRQYYKDCYIEGTVDFIFGWSTAVFDSCTIFCKLKGYITAASTLDTSPYGFVFFNCKITGDAPENSFYLGRPWRPYSKTVFIHCFLDKQIKPEGWHNWQKPDVEKTAYYAEYQSIGPGANATARVGWSHQLTEAEAKNYTQEKIFGDWKIQ
jgi:pectinesterase